MRTPAEKHARNLIAEHGTAKAREIARRKVDDSAFMVRTDDDRRFWIAVLKSLR